MSKEASLGKWGEDQASLFLERHGFRVVERNYHATVGEIDIVARKGDDFYFLEVKTRHEGPFEYDVAVTENKKHKLNKTIAQYCHRKNIRDVGMVPASLMVIVNKAKKRVNFRLAVLF